MEKEQVPATEQAHDLRVAEVVRETPDSCSLVLEVPERLRDRYRYRAGQFLTVHIRYESKDLARCYSLSSSPDCGEPHTITVKRVEGGRISNWINDFVEPGSVLKCQPPGGLFVLHEGSHDLVMFAGGSGITPVISLAKTTLATTTRRLRLLYANRDRESEIFGARLDRLVGEHPSRFELVRHYDSLDGFIDGAQVARLIADRPNAEFYVCGPAAFMNIVERALLEGGIAADRIHIERFVSPLDPGDAEAEQGAEEADSSGTRTLTIMLEGQKQSVSCGSGQTVLAAGQAAGLRPPFSCTEGFCGCCMAKVVRGHVRMRHNDFLSKKEVEQGWVLTCQALPVTDDVEVRYPE